MGLREGEGVVTAIGVVLVPRCCMDLVLVAGERAGPHMGKPIHLSGTFALPFKYHITVI
jgi:hypothetical protein